MPRETPSMIAGVDHLALSCADVGEGARVLEESGYRIKFVEPRLRNDPAKRAALRSYREWHSIAYGQTDGAVALELTKHAAPLREAVSPYQVLLNGPVPRCENRPDIDADWSSVWGTAFGAQEATPAIWKPFCAQLWINPSAEERRPASVRGVLIPSRELEVAERFWVQGLGCRPLDRGWAGSIRWVLLGFGVPVRSWCLDMILAETPSVPFAHTLPCLDDPGFPCMGLLTTRLNEDLGRALCMGGRDASSIFRMKVGGKSLALAFLRAPDGHWVELIELVREREA